MMNARNQFKLAPEVAEALKNGQPIVALESTVIAHGLPYPRNLETALELESIIRRHQCIPATIAVIGGVIRVGLEEAELQHLARADGIAKFGTRDLSLGIVNRLDGATTVSATAWIASQFGIDVFTTGGIGGVHLRAAQTLDISSDLWELARTSIIVVCAGAKAILDLPATLEWLETHQVGVYGFQTDEFPAFYSRHSGVNVEAIPDSDTAASLLTTRRRLGLPGGLVIAVPPPSEYELNICGHIKRALQEAEASGIQGKHVTPWLLTRIAELTDGQSVETNIGVLKNNAQVGAEIARGIARSLDDRKSTCSQW